MYIYIYICVCVYVCIYIKESCFKYECINNVSSRWSCFSFSRTEKEHRRVKNYSFFKISTILKHHTKNLEF